MIVAFGSQQFKEEVVELYVKNSLPWPAHRAAAWSGAHGPLCSPALQFPFPTLVHSGPLPGWQGSESNEGGEGGGGEGDGGEGGGGEGDGGEGGGDGARATHGTAIMSRAATTQISTTRTDMAASSIISCDIVIFLSQPFTETKGA